MQRGRLNTNGRASHIGHWGVLYGQHDTQAAMNGVSQSGLHCSVALLLAGHGKALQSTCKLGTLANVG